MKYIVTIFIFVCCKLYAYAQTDSVVVLSYQDYITIVINEHPYAKKADIKLNEGDAALLYARGAFDPKIYTDISQKYFKGSEYYSQINGGLKIPTWFGVELKGGYEQNQGTYLNPQNTTPNNGLIYAGISLPVGRGLLIDKRRADLKKAHLFQEISALEKQIIMNELVYAAGTIYWKWFKTYNSLMVYKDAYRLATERYEAVKIGANIGERPAIDTLEAGIQAQNRLLALQQASVDFKNVSLLLSNYLWEEGIIPLEVAEGTVPFTTEDVSNTDTAQISLLEMDSLINNHPELNQSQITINQLEIDNRLKRNQLLPMLNLKYNPITENLGGETLNNYSINNYTWGLEFQKPIFLRKERGALKLNQLKIQDYNLELSNKRVMLRYKAISAWNQWSTTIEQINLYAKTVEHSGLLLKGERKLFKIGESSLFMVNSREGSYVKAQLVYIDLLTKNKNAELTTQYSLGGLYDK